MRVEQIFPDIEIPDEEVDFFISNVSQMSMMKGDYFLTNNTVCSEIAFVDSGILRSVVNRGGREYVLALHFQNQIVCAFDSFFNQENSHWNIQALEPTHLTVISDRLFYELCQRHACWTQFWLRALGRKTADLVEREKHLLNIRRII